MSTVKYTIAKRLKEIGFDEMCNKYILTSDPDNPQISYGKNSFSESRVYIPTIEQVVDWFYKNHKLWTSVSIGHDEDKIWFNAYIEKVELGYSYEPVNIDFDIDGNSPEEAYEEAFEYMINIINK